MDFLSYAAPLSPMLMLQHQQWVQWQQRNPLLLCDCCFLPELWFRGRRLLGGGGGSRSNLDVIKSATSPSSGASPPPPPPSSSPKREKKSLASHPCKTAVTGKTTPTSSGSSTATFNFASLERGSNHLWFSSSTPPTHQVTSAASHWPCSPESAAWSLLLASGLQRKSTEQCNMLSLVLAVASSMCQVVLLPQAWDHGLLRPWTPVFFFSKGSPLLCYQEWRRRPSPAGVTWTSVLALLSTATLMWVLPFLH